MNAIQRRPVSRLGSWLAGLLLGLVAASALQAQPDEPPGRVGRLADMQGKVWLFDAEQGQWADALRNRALTGGDRLSTERDARAEVRIGSTVLRVAGGSEVEFARLDDERMVIQLHRGSVALRVRSREIANEVEVRTKEGRVIPERSGHYRVDRDDDTTFVSAWRGSLRFDAPDTQVQVPAGRRAEFFQQPQDRTTVVSWSAPETDAFADWVARDEQRDDRSASQRYVSPEMTGADDLDRYGRWERHPDYGMLWSPFEVAVGWAPYRYGRWSWQVRWGWTWIDDARWGFAPFHYGRWVSWNSRWFWSPGVYVARPAFAPALVAWVGGPHLGLSINIGAPAVGWVPLAPHDIYVPGFAYGPRYFQHVNRPHHPHPQYPPRVPTGPIMYGNKGVPGAVTVVPSNVLSQRQPVAAAMLRDAEVQQVVRSERFGHDTPVAAPRRVVAVPGGAQPMVVPPAPGRDAVAPGHVVDLRRERAAPVGPPVPAMRSPRSERPAMPAPAPARQVQAPAQAQAPAAAVAPAPPKGARQAPPGFGAPPPAPPTPAPAKSRDEAKPAKESKDAKEAKEPQSRAPESRQQQRDRQGMQ